MNPSECKHTITIDFETYYDKEYSLTKLTTQEYILDRRFEVLCVAIKVDDSATEKFHGTAIETREWLEQFPWGDACLVAHNAMFDASILLWHFRIMPKAFFCTMQGMRPHVVPYTPNGRMSLAVAAEHFKLAAKGTTLVKTLGKRRSDLLAFGLMPETLQYCGDDVDLCYEVYKLIVPDLPNDERFCLSLTVRKFVVPQLKLNPTLLSSELMDAARIREAMLDSLARKFETTRDELQRQLRSNEKFADLLRKFGVTPPTKISPTTGKVTYAFAKTDSEFMKLRDHQSVRVQALVDARLGVKSTIRESRLERFLAVARSSASFWFAIPLLYYGAHTGRFSGLDKLNLQNLPRGDELRYAIRAPAGKRLIVADESQVEARITAAFCNEVKLINAFTMGLDVYKIFASDLYGKPEKDITKPERFIGKQCILGLGFSMSWAKFKDSCETYGHTISEREAKRIVYFYRGQYRNICSMWTILEDAIYAMYKGDYFKVGPVRFMKNRCVLPNGMQLHYPDLELNRGLENGDMIQGWSYRYRGKIKKLYGGALLENIVQALARIVLVDAELALARRGIYAALSVHDELVYVANEKQAPVIDMALQRAMTADKPWLPSLPLACEADIGETYGDAK